MGNAKTIDLFTEKDAETVTAQVRALALVGGRVCSESDVRAGVPEGLRGGTGVLRSHVGGGQGEGAAVQHAGDHRLLSGKHPRVQRTLGQDRRSASVGNAFGRGSLRPRHRTREGLLGFRRAAVSSLLHQVCEVSPLELQGLFVGGLLAHRLEHCVPLLPLRLRPLSGIVVLIVHEFVSCVV